MKSASSASRPPPDIDAYIAGFPRDVQAMLQQIRGTIRKAAPDAEEAIRYQIPTFVQDGNLVHFAAFKSHIGFYPTPAGIEAFKEELSRYPSAKGSVRFPLDEPMPLKLIERIVKFRVKSQGARAPKDGGRSPSHGRARPSSSHDRARPSSSHGRARPSSSRDRIRQSSSRDAGRQSSGVRERRRT